MRRKTGSLQLGLFVMVSSGRCPWCWCCWSGELPHLKELVGVHVRRRRAPALAHEGVAEAEGEGGENHGDDRAQRQKGQEECASEGEELPGSVGETLQTLALQRAGLVELPTARTLQGGGEKDVLSQRGVRWPRPRARAEPSGLPPATQSHLFLLVKGQAPLLQLLGEERLHRLRSWLPLLRQVIIVYATPYQHVVSRSPAAGRAGAADRNPRPSGKGSPRRQRKPAITARHQPRHRHRRAVPGSVCDAFGSRVESSSRMKYLWLSPLWLRAEHAHACISKFQGNLKLEPNETQNRKFPRLAFSGAIIFFRRGNPFVKVVELLLK